MWINLNDDLKPLKDGSFLFSSERSGYRHLYRWNKGHVTALTSGPWVVDKLVGVDEADGRLFFTANRERSIDHGLYRLDYRRRGDVPRLLTAPGTTNSAVMDKTGRLAAITTSFPGQPSQVWIADGDGQAPRLDRREQGRRGRIPRRRSPPRR